MGMVFGEYYSAAISDNVKRKIQQKLHEGEWPGKAPIGFLNVDTHDDSGKFIRKDVSQTQHASRSLQRSTNYACLACRIE